MLAPVLLFVYNRSVQLGQVLKCLNCNELVSRTDLYIFSDGPKCENDIEKIKEVRQILDEFYNNNDFKSVTIYTSSENKGLAKSIINGVNEVICRYGKVIVLEDDLIVSKDFLIYMNQGLEFYQDDKRIGAISAYSLSFSSRKMLSNEVVYKSRTGNSWGWATWYNIWNGIKWEESEYVAFLGEKKLQKEFDKVQYGISKMLKEQIRGKIDSWAVRWDYYFFMNGLYTVYPPKSKVQNIGFGKESTHTKNKNDKKKNVVAAEGHIQFEEYEQMIDMTKETAQNFRIKLLERIKQWVII